MLWRKDPKWPSPDAAEIRKRTRILVIDDQAFPYEPLFKRDGYNIDKWDEIRDLSKLEHGDYDLILLDIQGVGTADSTEQGLGVLRHLKQVNPTQIIVAYSNADWSLKYQEFFKLADRSLSKGADYVDFKREVDSLLAKRFSLGFFLDKVEQIASEAGGIPPKLTERTRKAILRNRPGDLQDFLQKQLADPKAIDRILSVVRIAVGVATLFK